LGGTRLQRHSKVRKDYRYILTATTAVSVVLPLCHPNLRNLRHLLYIETKPSDNQTFVGFFPPLNDLAIRLHWEFLVTGAAAFAVPAVLKVFEKHFVENTVVSAPALDNFVMLGAGNMVGWQMRTARDDVVMSLGRLGSR
jgi:hypothetical protein